MFLIHATLLAMPLLPVQECPSQAAKKCSGENPTLASLNERKDIVDTAVGAGSFNTLVTAVKAAELVEVLKGEGPFTVFAPADSAFAKIPEGDLTALVKNKPELTKVLTYHVVPGRLMAKDVIGMPWLKTAQGQSLWVRQDDGKVWIDDAQILKTDIECSNGVIHVIDSVVKPRRDIVDTAVRADAFKTLVAAVKAAGLVETLKGEGPFTVFAPTDDAFAAIPEADLKALLADKDKLTAILTYHVIPGRVLSTDLKMTKKPVQVATVQGANLDVLKNDAGVMINQSAVIKADLIVGNGVIHVIDQVLLPPAASH